MGLIGDVLLTWRAPRRAAALRLAAASEARALAWLVAALVLSFAAGLPELARAPRPPDAPPFEAEAAGRLLGGLLFAPLVFYALAALGWLALRLAGGPGQGSGLAARVALYWAALAVAPVVLLRGLVVAGGLHGGVATALDLLAGAALLTFWGAGLLEARASLRQSAERDRFV